MPVYKVSLRVSSHHSGSTTRLTLLTAMSVLHMIKLFGWEPRVSEIIAETREDELRFIWKSKVLHMATGCIK